MSDDRKSAAPGLAATYRRFSRLRPAQPAPDLEALLALADGERSAGTERTLDDVARSGLHADLLRFTRALAPESARLGVQFERAFETTPAAGHRLVAARRERHGGARRWLRAAASLAACLLVAVAVWSVQQHRMPAPVAPMTSVPVRASTSVPPDRIFASFETSTAKRGDRIFRAEFHSDKIFKGAFNRG